jgi:hypothetical protein
LAYFYWDVVPFDIGVLEPASSRCSGHLGSPILGLPGFVDSLVCPGGRPPFLDPSVMRLNEIESDPYHWPIGRTSFQKLAYFANEGSCPVKWLRFVTAIPAP